MSGSGTSTLAVNTGTAAAGTYPLTINGVSGALSHTAGVSLTITGATGGGLITGSLATPPATVNLTSLGTADWAHWGLLSGTTFDHKAGITPLMLAAGHGNVEIVQALLAAGADPRKTDFTGRDALSFARDSRKPSIVQTIERAAATVKR